MVRAFAHAVELFNSLWRFSTIEGNSRIQACYGVNRRGPHGVGPRGCWI